MSVMDQSHDRLELLVIGNDQPLADEVNIRAVTDPRVKLVQADTRYNHGYVSEWNAGLRAMSGDVIVFLEPGMILDPRRLHVLLDVMYGVDRAEMQRALVIDPDYPESASRSAVHVELRDNCGLLNRNFAPPMAEWLGRLAAHYPEHETHVTTRNLVKSVYGSNDPEPPDSYSKHHRTVQYSGWWKTDRNAARAGAS